MSVMAFHTWEEIVKQIEQEPNPAKIAELAKKLNVAMITEEKEKVRQRLGIAELKTRPEPRGKKGADPPPRD